MARIRLLVVDADPIFTDKVCRSLAGASNIEIVGTECNGHQAMKRIALLHPDMILMDVQLPGMDGLSILKETRLMKRPPIVIFCTRFYSEFSMENAQRNGAAYFLYKPIEFHALSGLITECYAAAHAATQSVPRGIAAESRVNEIPQIRALLMEMGIPSRLTGNLYLVESILLIKDNRMLLSNLSKGLYSELSIKMGTTPARVERALRNAISIAYDRGRLKKYFACRPSNKEFIEYMLNALEANVCQGLLG